MIIDIHPASESHHSSILTLYSDVADIPEGIIRHPDEITTDYVSDFMDKSLNHGLILVAMHENQVVGEIHAYTPGIFAFQHILTDLTVVVSPDYQHKGIGRKLFERFLVTVNKYMTHILRIELFTREHNERNVGFYKSLGFVDEGRQDRKILMPDGTFETPLHMAWFNPDYTG